MKTDKDIAQQASDKWLRCPDKEMKDIVLEAIKKSKEGCIEKERITKRIHELKVNTPYMVCGIGHLNRKMIVGELRDLLE